MPRKSKSDYPPNMSEIAKEVKDEAGWKCVRCKHPHDRKTGHVLTVHHLDIDPQNCEWWNVPALCQRCHLKIQAKVILERPWMFDHSEWFKPYAAGFYASVNGYPTEREWVMKNIDFLLSLGRPSEYKMRKEKR